MTVDLFIGRQYRHRFRDGQSTLTYDLANLFLGLIVVTQQLLAHNAKVYLGARSQPKAEEAIKKLKELTGKDALFLKMDLADLQSVKAAAEEFLM
jgi:hypothetical protein